MVEKNKTTSYDLTRLKKLALYSKGRIGRKLDIGFSQNPNPFLMIDVGIDKKIDFKPKNYKRVIEADAENFTKKVRGKFGTIMVGELIEHLENPSAFLRECRKALNKNGILLITTPNPYFPPYVFFELLLNKRFYYKDDHLNLFPPRIMIKLLEHNGFDCKRIEGLPFQRQLLYVCKPTK
jgi:SAM-dependent methyltransferase